MEDKFELQQQLQQHYIMSSIVIYSDRTDKRNITTFIRERKVIKEEL